jgi:hypothetical protein
MDVLYFGGCVSYVGGVAIWHVCFFGISVHDAYLLRMCSATAEMSFEWTVGMILC